MHDNMSEEDRLFDEAVDILIRIQNDPENPVALDIAQRWLARGPKYQTIWAETLEIHGMTGKILTDQRRAARKAAFSMSRRTLVIGGLLGGGALIAAGYSAPGLVLQACADFITGKGEVRRVELPDGSYATLGPETAIALHMADAVRHVELLQGMAFFEVRPDPSRPFSVQTEDVVATALGTAFDVANNAGTLSVAVNHGLVGVDLPAAAMRSRFRLGAGEWLNFTSSNGALSTGSRNPSEIATWREGMIVVEKEPISSVVARIARWKSGRIVIASPSFGSQLVSGVYDLRDPALALEAVVQPHGGKVRTVTPYLTVVSPF